MKKYYLIRMILASIIAIAAAAAIYGFYPVKILDLQLSALVQRTIVDFSWIIPVLLIVIAAITLFFGRFYCSIICPFGFLQEFASIIFKKKTSKQKNLAVKYYIAALTFGALIGGSALLIRYIDPYTMFGSTMSLSIYGLVFTLIILVLVFFKNRYFCTNICPIGAILGLLSKVSLNKISINKEKCVSCGLCANSCPSGCIDSKEKSIDNETCVKCLKCFDKCKKSAIEFKKQSDIKFSPKRRELIVATSVFVVFGTFLKAGAEIGKNFCKKIQNVILPPGAENANRMANKCLNCNLCVQNCPGRILTKANKDFPAVHIDYTKGDGYCRYNCNKCSKICPTGAIKKITKEEKQKTRIAMATISDNKCKKCAICIQECPTGAINKINDKIVIDSSKCIGCAKCAKSCKFDAIEIFAINEQKTI